MPDTLTQAPLEEEIEKLNSDDDVDGIIVQVRYRMFNRAMLCLIRRSIAAILGIFE